ncbi:MAG: Dps family protein [Actinomycetota bacterium]|nr:Dps family protein [Actinomycetota bacterium]MDK1026100.1 Dps family protein [Actinomycetota bacterium]MDK1037355.1 Dps family protein [Actinomycetota bacterium]MDK1096166.1 Dps family protein [Actinomycetota bacterium]MDK1291113.1 Dps family protein [Actinomycetota bacterium]
MDIGIETSDRLAITESLSVLLADSYNLYLKTHGYHWNVTGPMFRTLHLMFEDEYTELADAVDEIAERIRSLGHMAPASFSSYGALSSIHDDTDVPEAMTMVANLVEAHETVARSGRATLGVAEGAGDPVTVDLATRRLEVHEKTAWMLRSLLEG